MAYADDVVIFADGDSKEELEEKLEDEIRILNRWSSVNGMTVSVQNQKTKCMVVSPARKPKFVINMTINGQQVECVDKFKYLGVLISNTLKWDEQFSCVLTKLQRLHFFFKKSHYYFEKSSMLLFVNGLFLFVIDYCLPIWGCVGTQFLTKTVKLLERILQTIVNDEGLQDFHFLLERANMLATSERMFCRLPSEMSKKRSTEKNVILKNVNKT